MSNKPRRRDLFPARYAAPQPGTLVQHESAMYSKQPLNGRQGVASSISLYLFLPREWKGFLKIRGRPGWRHDLVGMTDGRLDGPTDVVDVDMQR